MNETIGVKGGKNDRRRTIKIKEAQKKKLNEIVEEHELKELEKEVKKQQVFTLLKTLPIAIAGGTFKTLYDTAVGKPIDKEEVNSKWRIKEYDSDVSTLQHGEEPKEKKVIVTPTGEKVVVYIDVESKKNIFEDILNIPENTRSDIYEEDIKDNTDKKDNVVDISIDNKVDNNYKRKNVSQKTDENVYENINRVGIDTEIENNIDYGDIELSDTSRNTLQKLKARKILSEYERQLKDVRYELRGLIFDYNVLADAENEIVLSDDAQIILDKLSDIINRIEILKDKIKITDLEKYDDNYIYTLIEGYLAEFKDKKLVSEMKDSPLYILISEKIDEIETKKNDLNKRVDKKKEILEEKEENFDKLKDKYYNIERFNKEISEFQAEQEALLRSIQEKVANAVSVEEKVKVEVEGMTRQSRRTLRMLTLQMLFPGPRMARGLAATTASYLYFMRNIVNPRTVTKKYKEIKVIDYSDDIKNNIALLESTSGMLNRTSSQIDKMIKMINEEYSDYFDVVPECRDLLSNLKKIKSNILEKEYEMEKVKEQQLLLLEKNNAKVKTRGQYPM